MVGVDASEPSRGLGPPPPRSPEEGRILPLAGGRADLCRADLSLPTYYHRVFPRSIRVHICSRICPGTRNNTCHMVDKSWGWRGIVPCVLAGEALCDVKGLLTA